MPNLPFNINFITPQLVIGVLGAVVLLLYWAFNFTVIYHLTRFGVGTLPKKLAALFLLGSVALFFITASLSATIDFKTLKSKFTGFADNARGGYFPINYMPQ